MPRRRMVIREDDTEIIPSTWRRLLVVVMASGHLVACGGDPSTADTTGGGAFGGSSSSTVVGAGGAGGGLGGSGGSGGEGTGGELPTPPEVLDWQARFDAEWVEDDQYPDEADAIARSQSKNLYQEYYFLGYYIDGLVKVWQATGDNGYLDTALSLIDTTMSDAVPVGGGFLGWPSAEGQQIPLWDSYYWRHVATLTRILHQSPKLRETAAYQAAYEELLAFSEAHIWDRYEADGLHNFYRSRTHMASHWARIGMELFTITGKAKYKAVFDNISFGTMVNRPSNLREQLFMHDTVTTAYQWDMEWGVPQGAALQDTSHGGAVVSFWVLANDLGMYWTADDIEAVQSTLVNLVWPPSEGSDFFDLVDGTGEEQPGRLHEWLTLGRYDATLQARIKSDYVDDNSAFFGTHVLGIAAYNAKILAHGAPAYPEP